MFTAELEEMGLIHLLDIIRLWAGAYVYQIICSHKYHLLVLRGSLSTRLVTSAGKVGVFLDVFMEEFSSNWKHPF